MLKLTDFTVFLENDALYFVTPAHVERFLIMDTIMKKIQFANMVTYKGKVVKSLIYEDHDVDAYNSLINS